MSFLRKRIDLGYWNHQIIINDIKHLFDKLKLDFNGWKQTGNLSNNEYVNTLNTNMESVLLTTDLKLCDTLNKQLFLYADSYSHIAEKSLLSNLTELLPELKETYTGSMIEHMQHIFGKVSVKLFNRPLNKNLPWHQDDHITSRYHLVLWTNPGSFFVWTDKHIQVKPCFSSEDCNDEFEIFGKFIPVNNVFYEVSAGEYIHGIANIGTGWNRELQYETRCHLTVTPIMKNDY